jgi:hypothetical protein
MRSRKVSWSIASFVIACLLTSSAALAAGKITGKVIDVEGKPIANMLVRVNVVVDVEKSPGGVKTKYKISTGQDGTFIIDNVEPGKYIVLVSETKRGAASKPVDVEDGKEAKVELQTRKKGA